MTEIDAIKAVADALDAISVEERIRVLSWAAAKYGSNHKPDLKLGESTEGQPADHQSPTHPSDNVKQKNKKSSKKQKIVMSMDKGLNLSPPDKQSAHDFAAEKAPSTVKEKCVVAVYYLKEVLGLGNISAQAVFTFFKTVQWPTPADLKNTLQQAGTEGWLDTASSESIVLTSLGDNLVEYKLPSKKKK